VVTELQRPESSPLAEFPPFGEMDREWMLGFPRCEVDLGCARGHFLCEAATRNPGTCFVGVEWQAERVRKTRRRIHRHALPNARVFRAENSSFLATQVPRGSVDVLHVLFADPWPKRRHHRRRLVQPPFFGLAWRVLRPGGCLRFLTDDRNYAKAVESFALTQLGWRRTTLECDYPMTEFQARFIQQGLPIFSTVLRRGDSV
jgi:tRNA (guanine-N7-)-methyltransferase